MSASVQSFRMRSLCLLLAIGAAGAWAQPPQARPRRSASTAEQQRGAGSISGYVRQADTGEPVRKALVTAIPEARRGPGSMNPITAPTGPDGSFVLDNVESGQYRLVAERSGFVRGEYGASRPLRNGAPVQLNAGDALTNVDINLVRHSVVSGRITDEDGDPVQSAQVQLVKFSFASGRRQLVPAAGAGASTNDLGEYRLFGIAPGRYYLAVTPRSSFFASRFVMGPRPYPGPAPIDATAGAGQAYGVTFFPGTVDLAAATLLDIRVGSDFRGLDLRLVKTRTYRVTGRVVGAPLDRRGGAGFVMLTPKNPGASLSDRLSAPIRPATGAFEVPGVKPGSYTLTASVPASEDERLSARLSVEVGEGDVANLSLTPLPASQLSGVVRAADGTSVNLSSVRVQIESRDSGPFLHSDRARLESDGKFAFNSVGAGPYDLTVSGLGDNGYVKSIKYGELDVLANGLDLSPGSAASLDIVVSPNGAEISGSATNGDGKPQSGTVVLLIPAADRHRSDLFKTANADSSGAYRFRGLPPGDYLVFALGDHERGLEFDPKYIEQFEKQAEKITVRERGAESRPLRILAPPN